jgi:gliding motility-associated-like protein
MPVIYLGPDSSMCLGSAPVLLKDMINEGNPDARWLWNTGDTTASVSIKHYGHYEAKVTIDGCSASETINIQKDCYIDIPNAFTPNGDGVNDYFFPRQYLSKGVIGFTMSIFNRWGEKIFVTTNPEGRGWDGRFNGKMQPAGVYIYRITVNLKNGRTENYCGNVTMLY